MKELKREPVEIRTETIVRLNKSNREAGADGCFDGFFNGRLHILAVSYGTEEGF
jgi:hypothetical protein